MLSTSFDPVVATPRSREDVDAALATLERAGFGPGMLSFVDARMALFWCTVHAATWLWHAQSSRPDARLGPLALQHTETPSN